MGRRIVAFSLLVVLLLSATSSWPARAGSPFASASPASPELMTIAQARSQAVGSIVSVEGIVTVAAGSYNAGFAIQDGTAGIYVYPSAFVGVSLGDTVVLTGTLTSYNCLLEVSPNSSDVHVTGSAPVPPPRPYGTGDIGEGTEGWLVVVTGTVSGLPSNPFTVNDGSGAVPVYADADTGISLGAIHNGDTLRVIGFSSQYDSAAPCDSGWQVMPRQQSDLFVIDLIPPSVIATVPATGATGVSLYKALAATFNEDIAVATLDFALEGPAGPVSGTITYSSATHRATFTPEAFLQPQATYTATIAGTLEDLAGNPMGADYVWSFTSGDADTVSPLVVDEWPAPGATGVSIYAAVLITFSEDMDPDTINTSTILLKKGIQPVTGTVTYDPAKFRATFTPQSLLEESTLYQVTVKAGVTDLASNPMGFDFPWTFRTGQAPVMQVYHGDLHNHTSYSDGSGYPLDAFASAKACGLDFLALTDHSYAMGDIEWADVLTQAEAATQNGVFVGLRGFEYTQGAEGHINVYNTVRHATRSLVAGCTYCDYTPNLEKGVTVQGFYPWLAVTGTQALDGAGTVMQFNHPGWMNFNDWAYHPEVENVTELEEVGNGWGYSYAFSWEEWIRSLDYGWKVGATNNSDNHEIGWGCITPHRTGVLLPALTKKDLLEALRARHTFASEDASYELFFQANGYWMGSDIPNTGQVLFDVWGGDAQVTDTTTLVQLVTSQGQVISETHPNAAPFHWTFNQTVTVGSHYYFVLVEQADGDRIVSSPIWTTAAEDLRVTDLSVQPSLPTIYNPSLFTARVTNRGQTTQTITVTFRMAETPLAQVPATLGVCQTGPCSDAYVSISWQPTVTGPVTVSATIEGAPAGDNPDDNSRSLSMEVSDEKIPLILIDAGHGNLGVDPRGTRQFVDDLTQHGYNLLFNLDDIAATDLNTETVKLLILNAYGPNQLTAAETQAVVDYVQAGGSIWLNGMSDYAGTVSWANTVADRMNGLVDAIQAAAGSSIPIRFNDDEVLDGNNNNGYPWGILWHIFPVSSTTGVGMNVSQIQSWSVSSLVDAGHGALTTSDLGSDGFMFVLGDRDVGYGTYGEANLTHNADTDGDGDYFRYPLTVTEPLTASLPAGAGYDIPGPAGRLFFYGDSNDPFNMFAYVAGDSKQNELFNLETVMWLLGTPLQRETIAEARADQDHNNVPDNKGRLAWVEGTVTAAFGEFFDVLYVQDDTGGVTVFAPAGDIEGDFLRGTRVRVVATVDQYQGDTELQFVEAEQIRILGSGTVPAPRITTTAQAALEQSEGWLLQTEGLVTSWYDAQSFIVDDGSGPCRIFLDGYNQEPGNSTFESIRVGDWVRASGLGSEDFGGQRIRVRTESDIAVVSPAAWIYLPVVLKGAP